MNQIEHIMALAKEYRDAIIEDGIKRQALRTAIEQALSARVPEGYVLVPMEPTHEMRRAYHEIQNTNALGAAGSAWAAMLAAAPQPQPEKRPQNCGTGFCSCIECPYSDHFPEAGKMMEPFGYFRSTLDGWEDCAETDDGAKPLYEAPQPDHFTDAGKPMEREWVDLPPEEIKALANLPGAGRERTAVEMAYAVQAKLREKNT